MTQGWPRDHIGCNVTTCPNGKCRSIGECADRLPQAESPPLAPLAPVYAGIDRDSNSLWRNGPLAPAAPRVIIAFTGLAGSGKSTAAMHLVNRRGFQRVRFAGPLKAMMAALGLTQNQIEGTEKETPCALLGGKTPRYAMQTIGTEWGRDIIDSDLWIRAWQAALPATGNVVVDDCRFPNEAVAVIGAGGKLVRIERPGAGTSSAHVSEQHALASHRTLYNALDERNLREQVDILLGDLSHAAARAQ